VPGWVRRFLVRARATFSGARDRELRDELQLHLHFLEEEYTAQGMPPELARRRAHREFGNAARFQEASHDLFSFRVIEDLAGDLQHAIRAMRRSAGFTCIAVASLAVGIGAVTAAFAVLDAFMLRGLPVRDPDRLVAFSTSDSTTWGRWPYAAFAHWRSSPGGLFEVAAASDVRPYAVPLQGTEKVGEVRVSLVSGNYFQVMGADVALGRSLAESDAAAEGAAPMAVISHAFWERWFGRAPDVLSKTIDLQGSRYDVVGVAQEGFTGHAVGHPSDVWIPLAMQSALMPEGERLLDDRWGTGARWLRVMARLGDGVTVDQAAASANLVHGRFVAGKADALGAGSPDVIRDRQRVVSLLGATTGYAPERRRYGRPLVILFAVTALVLLVACANFTSLMLARSEGRRKEFGIRLALGGRRWRLIRQSGTECVVLALLAGIVGVLLADWATTVLLKQFAVMIVPVEFALALDARVLGFAAACVAVAIMFGLWPCTRPARSASLSSLYQSTSTEARPRTRALAGRAMLIGQLALCTVLLVAAGLLLRTVTNLRSQDLGFDRNVLLVSFSPVDAGYTPPAAAMLLDRVRARLTAVPGILAVGVSGAALLDSSTYWIDGSQRLTTDRGVVLPGKQWTFAAVGPGFFDAVGLSVIHGREFEDRDAGPGPEGVVVNQSLARFLFGDDNPVGRRLTRTSDGPMQTVLGVVEDATQTSPRAHGLGVIYSPLRAFNRLVLAIRTAGPPADAVPVVRHQLGSVAGDLPIEHIRTIGEVLDRAIAQERLMSAISLVLAILVVAIGCVGLYALMSYEVAQRTRELGIRLALGATGGQVMALVLRDCALVIVPALALGLPVGMAVSRPLSSQLYGVQPGDPWTLAAVALLLMAVGFIATARPARTASSIDPVALFRAE
jgi:predicted permease